MKPYALSRLFSLFILSLSCSLSIAQISQLGADINGLAADDYFGGRVAISLDGSRIVAGATGSDANGSNAGQVRVFEWNGSAWVQLGSSINGGGTNQALGWSVDISSDGSRIVIGAKQGTGSVANSGSAYIYEWNGFSWNQLGATLGGTTAFEEFGSSVAMSANGNRVAIGVSRNSTNGSNSGQVRVYDWNGSTWILAGSVINGESSQDRCGWAVDFSADGNRLAIGAFQNSGTTGIACGHVRVFDWSGAAWIQASADIDGEAAYDGSGYAVSLSFNGLRLAIGATRNNGGGIGSYAGHCRVFEWSGSAWNQLGADLDGSAITDLFGCAVSLTANGERLAVGGYQYDGNGPNSGHVKVFEWNGTAWVQLGTSLNGRASNVQFGASVAITYDGGRLVAGGPSTPIAANGYVRAFQLPLLALPVELLSFTAMPDGEGVLLNWSVAGESESDTYTLEKSSNGSDFTLLAQIQAETSGPDPHAYDFPDDQPGSGKIHYRLSHTDVNGQTRVLGAASVRLQGERGVIRLYPNPAYSRLNVEYSADAEEEIRIRLVSTTGQRVYRASYHLERGQHLLKLDVTPLSPGMYFLELSGERHSAIHKVHIGRE